MIIARGQYIIYTLFSKKNLYSRCPSLNPVKISNKLTNIKPCAVQIALFLRGARAIYFLELDEYDIVCL